MMSTDNNTDEILDIQLEIKGSYIFAIPSGTITEAGMIQLATVLAQTCKKTRLDCILINSGKFKGALNVTELYYASQKFAEIVGHDKKVAYINPPPHWLQEVDQFSRNVINTRGGHLELFESEEKAVEWFNHMTGKHP